MSGRPRVSVASAWREQRGAAGATAAWHGGCRAKGCLSSGVVRTIRGMSQNFLACDREQVFLMPPDVREWLPEGHLAWFVIDAVDAMDLAAFYAAYRQDGH